jgi:predicted ArsR family transcriptional regulator
MPAKHFLNQSQLESLTSPIRLAIVQRLEVDKQATAADLSRRMGRRVTSLYHHLKQLQDVGLVRVTSERKGPRRPEAVYALIAEYLSSAQAVKTARGRRSYGRAATRVADAGARAFSAAVADGSSKFEGAERNAMARYYVLRATKDKLARLNALLDKLEIAATQPSDDGDEIHLKILVSRRSTKR